MSSRRRLVARVLPALATVMAIGVVGVLIASHNTKQQDEVTAANLVGQDYLAEAAAFRTRIDKVIDKVGTDDPGELLAAVKRRLRSRPELADVTAYGRQHSASYRDALATDETLMRPYRQLTSVLKHATKVKTFTDAALEVLGLRVSDYLGVAPVSSSSLVRSTVVPAFSSGLDKFREVPVPQGQSALAAQVTGAVQYVIDQANALANSIDTNRNFSFTYGDQFNAAITAVTDYATVTDGDVAEAVAAVTSR